MGFVAETKAPDVVYQLLVFRCPRIIQEMNLLMSEPIIEKFNDNQIINGIAEVTLQNQDGVFKNYFTVTSLTVDT